MTTKRTYYCNFCSQELTTSREGYGLKWVGKRLEDVGVHLGNAENHICRECLQAIRGFMPAYVDPKDPIFFPHKASK